MNPILKSYFERMQSCAPHGGLKYFVYKRDHDHNMPYSVHFQFLSENGLSRDSWGSGYSQDEAFGKSLMEMIERLYFSGFSPFDYKPINGFIKRSISLFKLSQIWDVPVRIFHPANTNGVSIHFSLKSAIRSAQLELIERHTILYAIVMNISPHFSMKKEVAKGKECTFFTWRGPMSTFVTVGAYSDGNGAYFSSGCDSVLEMAVKKAELELSSFLFIDEKKSSEFEIIKDDIQSFNRYHKFSGDNSALEFLSSNMKGEIPDLDKNKFYFTKIPCPKIFEGLYSLPAVRVIHPDAQQLFFDNWRNEYMNPRTFPEDVALPSFPHIIA